MTHAVSVVLAAAMLRLDLAPDERAEMLAKWGGAQSVDELPDEIVKAAGG